MKSRFLFTLAALAFLPQMVSALTFSDADIVIPEKSSAYIRFCAEELSKHLKMITGGKFAVTSRPQSKVRIYPGKVPPGKDLKKLERDAFYIGTAGNEIFIAGKDTVSTIHPVTLSITSNSRGTLAGVHTFLEEAGIRWLAPGDHNTFVYKKKSITVPDGIRVNTPVFEERTICDHYNFAANFNRMDGLEYQKSGKNIESPLWYVRLRCNYSSRLRGVHTEQFLELGRLWGKKYPERFQLDKDGKRNTRYLCWTDPEVAKMWERAADAFLGGKSPAAAGLPHIKSWRGQNLPDTFMIEPMDHGVTNDGRCRCDRCNAFRKKYPCDDDSEIMWQVIAPIAEKMQKKYPGKYIATSAYPPMRHVPKTVKIPSNVRMRLCLPGPKTVSVPAQFQKDLNEIKKWSKIVGKDNLAIWTYQCEIHGRKLPGPPEMYPGLFSEYVRAVAPYCSGIFHESHGLSFTYKLLDTYLQAKMLWNPKADYKALRKEFFTLYYGPAAKDMEKLYDRFDANWKKYWIAADKLKSSAADLGTGKGGAERRKLVWSKVYSANEMNTLDKILSSAARAAAGNAVYSKRVQLCRKFIFDIMTAERRDVMNLSESAPTVPLNANLWRNQKVWRFVSAHRDNTKITAGAMCQVRLARGIFTARLEVDEPRKKDIKITPSYQNGNMDLWRDSCIEFYFHTPENNTLHHFIVNMAGKVSCVKVSPQKTEWVTLPAVKISVTNTRRGYVVELTMPVNALGGKAQTMRFNVTRERNFKKGPAEYTTMCPGALGGNWENPECFARFSLK